MKCPVCEKHIEPGKVIACVRCFALFPRKEQQRLREMYVKAKQSCKPMGPDITGKVEKLVRVTRERFPETRPTGWTETVPMKVGDVVSSPEYGKIVVVEASE